MLKSCANPIVTSFTALLLLKIMFRYHMHGTPNSIFGGGKAENDIRVRFGKFFTFSILLTACLSDREKTRATLQIIKNGHTVELELL